MEPTQGSESSKNADKSFMTRSQAGWLLLILAITGIVTDALFEWSRHIDLKSTWGFAVAASGVTVELFLFRHWVFPPRMRRGFDKLMVGLCVIFMAVGIYEMIQGHTDGALFAAFYFLLLLIFAVLVWRRA